MREEVNAYEKAAIEMRDKAISQETEEIILPDRSFLKQPEYQGVTPAETIYDDGRPSGFKADLGNGRSLERNISYVRQKGPDEQYYNTDEVAAISEKLSTIKVLDQGRTTRITEVGKDLHQEHGWESTITEIKNDEGKLQSKTTVGRTTEGEKAGEEWQNSETHERRGDVIKKSRINKGKHFIDGKLVSYSTLKANYAGPDGKDFFYISREYNENGQLVVPDEENKMKWSGNVPHDFKEW